jgi:hypothetical protein
MEHTALTVEFAATVSWSKVRTPAGRMAIANVCQMCGLAQGRLRALALPADTTSPAQHSGLRGQRAPDTDAAGHPLVTVGTPNPAAGAATGLAPVLAPVLAGAGGPVLAPGERTRAPTTAAAATSRTTLAAAASSSVTGRRRRAGMGGAVPPGPSPAPGPGGVPGETGASGGPAEGTEYGGGPGAAAGVD